MALEAGTFVGPYEIVAQLGSGGMGEVYRARDPKLDREIALKILLPQLAESSEHLRRFEQEARAASALNHPGIVAIYDVGRDGPNAYIAMEIVDGRDLRGLLADGPIPVRQVMRIASKVADALAAAHERGIVHRDLKPENVIVSKDGFVKILDFGLAKLIRPLSVDDPTLPHTHPGSIFGTIGYMSPEQAAGRPMDFRSDQFSLGVIFYELLARRRPFEESSAPETMTAIIRSDPPPIAESNGMVPVDLERLILRCLAKDPRDRYGSTRDLARDLRELRDGYSNASGGRSRPIYSVPRRKRNLAPIAASIAALILLAGGALFFLRKFEQPRGLRGARSLGVLPFRDATGTGEGQAFADGVAETISTRLTQANAIRIAPLLDGSAKGSLADIAQRRGADLLLRGTVQRAGDQVRLNYAIIDPLSGEEVVADMVTGASAQMFQLEDTVADRVLQSLRVKPRVALAHRPTGLERAADQSQFLEAVGLMKTINNEASIDQAVGKLQKLLINARDSADVNAELARALMMKYQMTHRASFLDEAALYAERAVQLDPDSATVHVALGNVRRFAGQPAEAMTHYRKALDLQPNLGDAVIGTAETYEAMGRAADAQAAFERAIALRPDSPNYYNRYGAFCFARGNYVKAAALFRRMTVLLPDAARGWANLGGALLALGRYDEALAAYERSIAITPTGGAWSNIGTARFLLGRYADACDAFEKASQLAPADYTILANLGDAYRWTPARRKDAAATYDRAIAAARTSLTVNDKDALAHAMIASCLAKNGNAEAAQKEIRAALTLDPTNANVLYLSAIVAELGGDHDRAAEWLLHAIDSGYTARAAARDPELAGLRSREDVRHALQS